MASDTVSLYLGGEPTLDDFAPAISSLHQMLTGLARMEGAGKISWTIEDLERASAQVTFRGVSEEHDDVERVTDRYLKVGRDLLSGIEPPRPIRQSARRLLDILNDRVPDIRFETADDDVTITSEARESKVTGTAPASWGAVTGRVQVLSNRGSLHFTLYDAVFDKPVSCYLQEDQSEQMRDVWGRTARVEGYVKRDPGTGRPLTVRQVRRVEPIEEANRGDWRRAEGVLRGVGHDEPAEDTIRRLRDAQ